VLLCCCAAVLLCCCAAVLLCCCAAVLLCCCALCCCTALCSTVLLLLCCCCAAAVLLLCCCCAALRCVGQCVPAIIAFVAAHSERVAGMVDVMDSSRFSFHPACDQTHHHPPHDLANVNGHGKAAAMAWRSGPRRGAGGTALEA
jgi:hypothetical protein